MKFVRLRNEIDGNGLYCMFVAGAAKILRHQVELNRINVFPVPDGDTGSNLASTVRSVLEKIKKKRDYKYSMNEIADAAIDGARGNSGVIFAQFLHGLREETSQSKSLNLHDFAVGVKGAVHFVYDAISQPVEGTMLTVMREWADFLYINRHSNKGFREIFVKSIDAARRSLLETKYKLEVLKKANVVDAGGKGFVIFLEGINEFFRSMDLRSLFKLTRDIEVVEEFVEHVDKELKYKYCTETVITGEKINQTKVKQILSDHGDSIVIAGSEKRTRIHIHTDDPASLFYKLREEGELTGQKADNMKLQTDVTQNKKYRIALVTDTTCDLPDNIFETYQIHQIPINIKIGESEYLDRITITSDQIYSTLRNSLDFPKSSQPPKKSFENLFSFLSTHYDSVISVHLSDQLSGTFSVAKKAAEKISSESGKKITVINSKHLSGSLGMVVLRIAEAIKNGSDHEEIVKMSKVWIDNTDIFVSVKTLKYMVRGGRVSPMKGKIAKLLNLTPIVSIDKEGKSILIGKSFGQKNNMRKVVKHINALSKMRKVRSSIILHAENRSGAEYLLHQVKQVTGREPVGIVNISPIIGVNAGLGAVAIALMFEQDTKE